MCGIAGIFAYRDQASPVDREELLRIREAMRLRGPDGEGLWVSRNGRVGLAHRRLAIIDLTDDGLQPMATPDGALHITFNGEIYNYRELRRLLESKGYIFRTNSDTEVLLHLYRAYGIKMLEQLRGMYAFALWDQSHEALLLARDPLGIKPLYYVDDGATIRAASQVKALIAGGNVDGGPDPAGHVGFLLWGFVPEPYTIHRDIRALPAGCAMWIEHGKLPRQETIFSVTKLFESVELESADRRELTDRAAWTKALRSSLQESVRRHLVSDVPVGLFLSAGIDSATLAGHVTEVGGDLRTVTLGFHEYRGTRNDETRLAEQVARALGASHQTVVITKNDFQQDIVNILSAMDQPSIDGVNTYLVAKVAASTGLKVALTGLGGDEQFAGYDHFQKIDRIMKASASIHRVPGLGKGFRIVSGPILKHLSSPKHAALFEYGGNVEGAYLLCRGLFMPWELPEFMDPDMAREGWRTLQPLMSLQQTVGGIHRNRLKITALEMNWYLRCQLLRDADWASMANSLEVRTPLVDWQFLCELAPLLASAQPPGKADLARTPAVPLPDEVLDRTKTGFVVPINDWIREQTGSRGHGSREWARIIYRRFSNNKRALVLVTDAYGGHGGIAKFNRDLLTALPAHPEYQETVALPRVISNSFGDKLPNKLRFFSSAAESKVAYIMSLFKLLLGTRRFDVVVCGHINLLPMAWVASRVTGAPLMLICHGIEAWKPTSRWLVNQLAPTVDCLVAVSALTRDRFRQWVKMSGDAAFILPNCVDLNTFQPRAKKQELLDRYQLHGKTLIMTLARLSGQERYKGVDEVLEVLPNLLRNFPHMRYMAAGSGEDLPRLQRKAESLGIADRVIFPGQINESDKVDYYNLADAFVMPGQGEGFGIVYLEAMACGVPAVGSLLDGSREALQEGKLGVLVDPLDLTSVEKGIRQALSRTRGVPSGLDYFAQYRFRERFRSILDKVAIGPIGKAHTT